MIIAELQQSGDWLNIVLEDSRKVSVNITKTPKAIALKEGDDLSADWTINEWKDKTGQIKLFLNEKKKGFPKRDYGLEKKIAALQAASRFISDDPLHQHLTSDEVLQLADKYLKWLQ